jgi:RNA polymerase sigma-70 factor (ECF subfamily)
VTLDDDFDHVLGLAQAGEERAITRIYRDLNPSVLRFLSAQARDAGEDLAQETWMAVAKGLPAFVGNERAFRGWVFTIARRRLVQLWRTEGRRPSIPLAPEDLALLAGAHDSPDTAVIARAAAAELVASLPQDQAEIILLRVVGGFEAAEVAEIVGRTAVAVRVLQHRALKRIGLRLGAESVTP